MSDERPQPTIVAFEEDPSARERIESELLAELERLTEQRKDE